MCCKLTHRDFDCLICITLVRKKCGSNLLGAREKRRGGRQVGSHPNDLPLAEFSDFVPIHCIMPQSRRVVNIRTANRLLKHKTSPDRLIHLYFQSAAYTIATEIKRGEQESEPFS
jgi:hypothetical protein